MASVVRNSDISPIYRKLYLKVADRPAMLNVKEGILKAVREATRVGYKYKQHEWQKDRITVDLRVKVGHLTVETSFELSGDEAPTFGIETEHLIDEEGLLEIFFENVDREDKPIKQHGLVQRDTIIDGALPRRRNQFVPWMVSHMVHSDEFYETKKRAIHRLGREVLATLQEDGVFQQFAEDNAMSAVIEKLSAYAYLPPEAIHRAVDLMYVQMTMEK